MNNPFFEITIVLFALVWLKSVIVGSDFSFIDWIKYGRLYSNWYNERPTFRQYINKLKVEEQKRKIKLKVEEQKRKIKK